MNRTKTAAVTALTMLALAGCEEATGPAAGRAEIQASVQGDDPGAQTSEAPEDGVLHSADGSGESEVRVVAQVFVWAEAEGWVEVTRGAAEQTVRASGEDGAHLLAEAEVEAGVYRRVRIEFQQVEADVSGEVQVGTGLGQGTVQVKSDAEGPVVVEREIELNASSRSTSELRIDLNAQQWMGRADATTRTVAEADFQSAVAVSIR